jgi:FkbM family methyltransferase
VSGLGAIDHAGMSKPSLAQRAHRIAVAAVASRRRNPVVRGLARSARSYLALVGNHSYDPARNGEFWTLRALATGDVRCIFDVGANEGDWVSGAAPLFPQAIVHCFEIVPDTARELVERTRPLGNRVHVNAVGLSDAKDTLDVRVYPDFSEGASAAGYEHAGVPSQTLQCEVITGDAYCDEHGIEHIDLLKIDTEGLDLRVLHGFDRMLASGAVDVVQFEYGFANISSRALLADFYSFLGEHEFAVGKIWPREVEFRDYDPRTDEDFAGPNYLAVRNARADLIAQLSPH